MSLSFPLEARLVDDIAKISREIECEKPFQESSMAANYEPILLFQKE
jgi:hypothetical protein